VLRGVVSALGVPTVTLTIAGRDWLATIDTGFNGDLELPAGLRDSFNGRYIGRSTAALAGGQSVEEDVFIVDFPFDGETVVAEATFVAGSEILIGTHLLREYSLWIDFVSKTVLLERGSNPPFS